MTASDPGLVRTVHREVGDRLQREQIARRADGRQALEGQAERQFARKVIGDVIGEHVQALLNAGRPPMDLDDEAALADGIHARMFGAGRLQALLDDTSIENIDINGCDEVWVTRAGTARHERIAAVAASDEELVELVQSLAAYAGINSRPWDTANPEVDLQLPDGSRLSAVQGVTARPSVSIRRHRFETVTLADLVGNNTMSPDLADFLAAAVRARHNVMIAGATRAGKTTLLRAMAAEISPDERIITVERALELGLRKDTVGHPNCVELEERVANSEGHGAVSMARLVRRTLRQNPDRVIVGEVLGPEVIDMLNAMGQGNDGSMSTIHARSARDVFRRIATYAIQSAERLPHQASYQLVAGGLDFVVFVSRDPSTGTRRVNSVLEVNGYDDDVLASEIFAVDGTGHAAWTGVVPARCEQLAAAGLPGGLPGASAEHGTPGPDAVHGTGFAGAAPNVGANVGTDLGARPRAGVR